MTGLYWLNRNADQRIAPAPARSQDTTQVKTGSDVKQPSPLPNKDSSQKKDRDNEGAKDYGVTPKNVETKVIPPKKVETKVVTPATVPAAAIVDWAPKEPEIGRSFRVTVGLADPADGDKPVVYEARLADEEKWRQLGVDGVLQWTPNKDGPISLEARLRTSTGQTSASVRRTWMIEAISTCSGNPGSVIFLAFHPRNEKQMVSVEKIAVQSSGEVVLKSEYCLRVYDIETKRLIRAHHLCHRDVIKNEGSDIVSVSLSPDGSRLVLIKSGEQGTVHVVDVQTGAELHAQTRIGDSATSQALKLVLSQTYWHPDGKSIILIGGPRSSDSRGARVSPDLKDVYGKYPCIFGRPASHFLGTISASGKWMLTCAQDRFIELWDVDSAMVVKTWTLQHEPQMAVRTALSRDLKWLAFTPEDSISGVREDQGSVICIPLSLDVKDTTPTMPETRRGAPGRIVANTSIVMDLKFSPLANLLACADYDGNLWLWDADASKLLSLPKQTAKVRVLAFDRGRPLLASGSEDGWIRIWHTADGGLQHEIRTGKNSK